MKKNNLVLIVSAILALFIIGMETGFLDKHSSAIIAIFTAIYVMGTLLMWQEMKKSRERLDEPNIQISFEQQTRWGNFLDLVIENIGNTTVYNLRLAIEPKGLKTAGERKLEDINLFKTKIPTFGVGQKLRTNAIAYLDFMKISQPKQFSIIAKYMTKFDKIKEQKYDFDMEIYRGMSASAEKSLNDIEFVLQKINRNMSEFVDKYGDQLSRRMFKEK